MKKRIVALIITAVMVLSGMSVAWADEILEETSEETFIEETSEEASEEASEETSEETSIEEVSIEAVSSDGTMLDAKQQGQYLTFAAKEKSSGITLNYISGSNVMYSLDGGSTWKSYTEGTKITLKKIGSSVCFKGTKVKTNYSEHFAVTGKVAASGDVTSLTNGVGGDCALEEGCYSCMFSGCTGLIVAPELPATTLAARCYQSIFSGCTGLEAAPKLPATSLKDYCYSGMFSDCVGLTAMPTLPATTLAEGCYSWMFENCTGLTVVTDLPATSLSSSCYVSMFSGCTGIKSAPKLPAKALADYCYWAMFSGCTGLTAAPALSAKNLADSCYCEMFSGCAGLTAAPKLPATTLAKDCYLSMFSDCVSLTEPPQLPATKLAEGCYYHMFENCTKIRVSASEAEGYTRVWTVTSGTSSVSGWGTDMFAGTGGTFKGTPKIGSTYYIQVSAISTPSNVKAKAYSKYNKITWGKVTGATGYKIYRKANGEKSYSSLKVIRSNGTFYYKDKTAKPGVTYYYIVRAYTRPESKNIWSKSSKAAQVTTQISAPTEVKVKAYSGYNKISWKAVSGVVGYRIYRKSGSGKYKSLKTIRNAETQYYKDTSAEAGVTYTYCIKAYVRVNGKTLWSPASDKISVK